MATHRILSGSACFTTHVLTDHLSIFNRPQYSELVCQSLTWCRTNGGIKVFGYVVMPDHIHLLTDVPSPEKLEKVLRSFRNYVATHAIELFKLDGRSWAINALEIAGRKSGDFRFWETGYRPVDSPGEIFSQKLHYIHMNPVRSGFVNEPKDWVYSSARAYSHDLRSIKMKIDFIDGQERGC